MDDITVYLIIHLKYTQDAIKKITVNPTQKINILDSYTSNVKIKKYIFKGNILVNNSTFLDYQIKDDDIIFLWTKEQTSNTKIFRRMEESTNNELFVTRIRLVSNPKLIREAARISDLKRVRYETKQLVYSSSLFLQREINMPNYKSEKNNINSEKSLNLDLDYNLTPLDQPANQPLPICF